MDYAICTVSAAPVRKENSHRSEMVNQLLFGEAVQVMEYKEEWIKVRSVYDGYEGWLTEHLINHVDLTVALSPCNYISTGLLNPVTLPDELINLPMGSSLTGFDEETRLLWDEQYKYHGTYNNINKRGDIELFWRTVYPWLNAPYLWGGRTFMGVDCSGFVQVVFKVMGIQLLRDAWQQANQGEEVDHLIQAQPGDVAFFKNKEGRIVHVGIILEDGRIIHASGKVRIDGLDEGGIIHTSSGKQTHELACIRRFL